MKTKRIAASPRFPAALPSSHVLKLTLALAGGALIATAALVVTLHSSRNDSFRVPPAPVIMVRPPVEIPQGPPTFDERFSACQEMLRLNPRQAVQEGEKLALEYPERRQVLDLVLRARVAGWEFEEPIGDVRFDPVLKHIKEMKPARRYHTLNELESMIQRVDELLVWSEEERQDPIARSMACELVSALLGRIGAHEESDAVRELGQEIFPSRRPWGSNIGHPLKGVIDSVNAACRAGDPGPARRLRAIAQRFRLHHVLKELSEG
jgi:hypothetical protein